MILSALKWTNKADFMAVNSMYVGTSIAANLMIVNPVIMKIKQTITPNFIKIFLVFKESAILVLPSFSDLVGLVESSKNCLIVLSI